MHEIRRERRSNILFMPQYAQPWKHRLLQSTLDAIRTYPDFPQGSRTWDERAYHPDANGVVRPLSELWPKGAAPASMRWADSAGNADGLRAGVGRIADGVEQLAANCAWHWVSRKVERARDRMPHELNGHGALGRAPRVAYFPDSFHEINGVAHTSRNFEAFARRRGLPFLCVRAGDREQKLTQDGNVWTLELPRGFLSFALEKDLRFDPAFVRHLPLIEDALARFEPDLIHITGPSEVGMLGAALAHTRRFAACGKLAHQRA